MTSAGILKTAKQLIQKLWKFIVFSAEFISTIILFNINTNSAPIAKLEVIVSEENRLKLSTIAIKKMALLI